MVSDGFGWWRVGGGLVCWFVGWLVVGGWWLVSWFVDSLVSWLVGGWLVWLVGRSGWLVGGWLAGAVGRLIGRLVKQLVSWLVGRWVGWLVGGCLVW